MTSFHSNRICHFTTALVTRTMSAFQEEFNLAVEVANKLPKASNEDMLEMYGWFKQSNLGDVNTGTPRPDDCSVRSVFLTPDPTDRGR